ncbi:MAG: glycerate kinase [Desulfobaccales bacterium]
MNIILAPDSFKGSLTSLDAARCMRQGLLRVFPQARVTDIPIADGGEGTVPVLLHAVGGEVRETVVMGPLGRPVAARWGLLAGGETAVIEMAAASGLPLVPELQRDPLAATTWGAGELVRAALAAGVRKIILGLGGSATNDGGSGLIRALGAKFLDGRGRELPLGGAALADLASIDLTGLDPRLQEVEILVASDVDNPLCGPQGATAVFGPQKGATPEMVVELDRALARYAQVARDATGKDVAALPGAGAAGGSGAGLLFFTPAVLRAGVAIVLETAGFEGHLAAADLVITGEGRTDSQTVRGKAPVGVARLARRYGVPVVCISGGLGEGAALLYEEGVEGLVSCAPGPLSLEEALNQAPRLLTDATERACRLIRIGMDLGRGLKPGHPTSGSMPKKSR